MDKELLEFNDAARKAAEREYENSVVRLIQPDPGDDASETPLKALADNLSDRIFVLKEGRLGAETLDSLLGLRLALVTPANYTWYFRLDETRPDPISGKPIPKDELRSWPGSIANELTDLRKQFCEYLKGLAALAKRVGSPAYPDFRAIYIAVRTDCGSYVDNMLSEELADEVLPQLEGLLHALAADFEIAAFEVKVGKGGRK